MAIRSALLDSIVDIQHGFGTRAEPRPSPFVETWDELRPRWRQVHGVACAHVETTQQDCGEADALFSSRQRIPISVQTADCVPILLAAKDGKTVAAVHAGWRGTQAKILAHLWRELSSRGHKPGDWIAAVGPSAGPCCYEVSEELARDFAVRFTAPGRPNPVPSHRHLDLPAINAGELQGLGIGAVDILRQCTLCARETAGSDAPYLFNSYRRDGKSGRQWSVIRICPAADVTAK